MSDSKIQMLEERNIELEDEVTELRDRLEAKDQDIESLKGDVDDLSADLTYSQDRENDLENQRDDLLTKLGIAEQFIQWVEEVYPQARQEYNAVHSIGEEV